MYNLLEIVTPQNFNFESLTQNMIVWMPREALSGLLTRSVKPGVLFGTDIPLKMFLSALQKTWQTFRVQYIQYFSSTYLCSNVENTKERQNSKDRGNPVMQLMSRFKGMSKVKRTVETPY